MNVPGVDLKNKIKIMNIFTSFLSYILNQKISYKVRRKPQFR